MATPNERINALEKKVRELEAKVNACKPVDIDAAVDAALKKHAARAPKNFTPDTKAV